MILEIYIQKQTNRISIFSWLYIFLFKHYGRNRRSVEKIRIGNPTKMGKQVKFYIQSKRYYELKHLQR